MTMRRIVIAGAGLAGLSAGQELRRLGFGGDLHVIGAEPHRPYRRPPLSKEHLEREGDLLLRGADELGATWLLGRAATGLDVAGRRVRLGAESLGFDGLVIATGLRAKAVPDAWALPGVHTVRTVEDARALREAASRGPGAVVVGGGFIGSEAASTLRSLGLDVTLVAAAPLRGPLGAEVSRIVTARHREYGVDVRAGRLAGVSGTGRVERVLLDDGTVLPTGLVVAALGSEPETDWLRGSGIGHADGVDIGPDGLATPGIAAAGDVARRPHPLHSGRMLRIGHYANAAEEGVQAARALMGRSEPYTPVPTFWSHLYGARLQAVGFTGEEYTSRVVAEDGRRFLVEYHHADRLVGVAAAGFARALPEYRQRIRKSLE
ncbi:NAD(P)/FAD-dependent oxidoreductase [Glycomyces sp. NPDC048151]|uniref:NAD(P)/FAD-dependent oxidoreductase n=1 Tax=Glycomyces sp. NPDC048151 TaxID=3364002 RepID=UPI00371E813E